MLKRFVAAVRLVVAAVAWFAGFASLVTINSYVIDFLGNIFLKIKGGGE